MWKISPPPIFDPWTVQLVVSRYTDLRIRYSKIWRVAKKAGWLPASLPSQACDSYSVPTKVFFFFCSGVYYLLHKENYRHVSVSFTQSHVPCIDQIYRFFKRTRKALECMNVGYYIVATDVFRPLMWPSSGWQEKEYSHNYNLSESIHSWNIHIILVKYIIKKVSYK